MCLSEVGHCELTVFFKTRIAELSQVLMPVPNLVTQCRVASRFVVQSNFYDAMNVAQTFLQFKIGMTFESPFKCGNDLMFVEAFAAGSPYSQNEGPAKFFVVRGIECLDFFKLFRRAISQTRLALFVAGLGR